MSTRYKGDSAEVSALNVFINLFRAADTIEAQFGRRLRQDQLTGPQFGVLETLHHLGSLEQHVLAKKLLVSRGNITFIVDKLEQMKLVMRVAGTEDRRCNRVSLTESGSEFITRIFPNYAAFISNLIGVLDNEEQIVLAELLKKLGKQNNQQIESQDNLCDSNNNKGTICQ